MVTDIDALKLECFIPREPPIGPFSPLELKEMVIKFINNLKASKHIGTHVGTRV